MDFWNRLIGGSGLSSSSTPVRPPPPQTPEQRLGKFKRIWQTLLHSWRNARANDPNCHDMLRSYIKRLNDTLAEEEKRSATQRLCMNFAYDNQIYIAISKIGATGSVGVVKECIISFGMMVDNEEEEFMGNESFAQSIIAFLEGVNKRGATQGVEGEFVELLFSVAAKIRLSPGILRVWFTREGREEERKDFGSLEPLQKFVGITNKEDFPLFYLLIDYVHQEGRVGDFARTGLLYIVEATSSSKELEQWIVESDLSTLMASGLGALYSQLSRKLVVAHPPEQPPTILLLSETPPMPPAFGAITSTSGEFQSHLETFLSYLIFWQDVLEYCRSAEVKQTLLDHFQVLFLQQLLYPSLLESSDVDGGSAVAVLTYVRVILDTLEHPDMIHLILSYLMNLPEKPVQPMSPGLRAKRRKSIDLLSKAAAIEDNPTPAIYSLADLISTSLGSKSPQTVAATLRLISTVLRKHYPYAMNTLFKIIPTRGGVPDRTIGALNQELDLLFSMATGISEQFSAEKSYGDHLRDCMALLESHPCTAKLLGLKAPNSTGPGTTSNTGQEQLDRMHMHTIHHHDPVLQSLVDLLSRFFTNPVETNLVLTSAIVDLGACGWMRPEGWLFFDPTTYELDDGEDSDQEEQDELDEMEEELEAIIGGAGTENEDIFSEKERRRIRGALRARRRPRLTKSPPIIEALQGLVVQIQSYRRKIPDLDERLAEHRQAFEVTDGLNEALLGPLPRHPIAQTPKYPSKLDPFPPHSLVRPSSSSKPRTTSGSSGYSTPTRTSRVPSRTLIVTPSPIRGLSPRMASSPGEIAQRRIKVLQPGQKQLHLPPPPDDESREGSVIGDAPLDALSENESAAKVELSLAQLMTNIMILQEFILELAALTQVRASLYSDIKFA